MRGQHGLVLFVAFFAAPLLRAATPGAPDFHIPLNELAGQAEQTHRVEGRLLADVSAITPGKPFMLAVELTMTPHWHIYWKNSGDAGGPPRFEFTLPEGFSAGDVQYPIPEKFVQAGPLTTYGYEGTVHFLVPVTPPKDASGSQTIKLTVHWMCCATECELGETDLHLTLPVSAHVQRANEEIFKQAAALMPAEIGAQTAAVVTQSSVAVGTGATWTIGLSWKEAADSVEVFPDLLDEAVVEKLSVNTNGLSSQVSLTARPTAGRQVKAQTLPLLVTYKDKAGRHGFYVPVDLTPLKSVTDHK